MQLIRGGRKLTRRELRAGGPNKVLDATAVINPRYGNRGELKWLAVHHQCVLPGDDFGQHVLAGTQVPGLRVPADTPAAAVRCDRCGGNFETMRRHLTVAQ